MTLISDLKGFYITAFKTSVGKLNDEYITS